MKKILSITLAILGVILGITSCEFETITLPESQYFVAFDYRVSNEYVDSSSRFRGNATVLKIPVFVAGAKTSAITVDFEVSNNDLNESFTINTAAGQSFAEEGVNFQILNSTKTLHFPNGVGHDTIFVQAINTAFTGHKFVFLNLVSNSAGYRIGYRVGPDSDSIVRASHRIRFY
jgi:hypothetical protein